MLLQELLPRVENKRRPILDHPASPENLELIMKNPKVNSEVAMQPDNQDLLVNRVKTKPQKTTSPDLLVSNALVRRTLNLKKVRRDLPAKTPVETVPELMLMKVRTDLLVSSTETIELKVAKTDPTTTTEAIIEAVKVSVELKVIVVEIAIREVVEAATAVAKVVVAATEATATTVEVMDNPVVAKATNALMALIVSQDVMEKAINEVVAAAKATPAADLEAASPCTALSPLSNELYLNTMNLNNLNIFELA